MTKQEPTKMYRVMKVYASQKSVELGRKKATPQFIGEYRASSAWGAMIYATREHSCSFALLEATEIVEG